MRIKEMEAEYRQAVVSGDTELAEQIRMAIECVADDVNINNRYFGEVVR